MGTKDEKEMAPGFKGSEPFSFFFFKPIRLLIIRLLIYNLASTKLWALKKQVTSFAALRLPSKNRGDTVVDFPFQKRLHAVGLLICHCYLVFNLFKLLLQCFGK